MSAFTNGLSAAGQRIRAAGLAFQRTQPTLPPPSPASAPANASGDALAGAIRAALDARRSDREPLPLGLIVAATAAEFGFHPRMLRGESRKRTHVVARHAAAYLCQELTGGSCAAIGRALGGRDHTTIIDAIRVTGRRIAADPRLATRIDALRARLEGATP